MGQLFCFGLVIMDLVELCDVRVHNAHSGKIYIYFLLLLFEKSKEIQHLIPMAALIAGNVVILLLNALHADYIVEKKRKESCSAPSITPSLIYYAEMSLQQIHVYRSFSLPFTCRTILSAEFPFLESLLLFLY